MQFIKPDADDLRRDAMSMGSLLLAGGAKERMALPNCVS
jgi:ATP-dependent protease ClpP protease subunit